MKNYKSKRKSQRARAEVSLSTYAEALGDWSVFELIKPSELVLEDVIPKVCEVTKKISAKSGIELPTDYAHLVDTVKDIAKKNTRFTRSHLLPSSREWVEKHEPRQELLDLLESYGFTERSFITNFMMFHPIGADDTIQLTAMMFACNYAYELIGRDETVSIDAIAQAYTLLELSEDCGDKWTDYILLYIYAYLIQCCKELAAERDSYKQEVQGVRTELVKWQNRKPEVETVVKQIGADRLQAAQEEARSMRNELASHKLQIEHEVQDSYADKLSKLEAENAKLRSQLAEWTAFESASDDADIIDDIAVPEEGILCVCGLPPMCAAIQRRFPKWKFLTSDTDPIPQQVDYVILCASYTSHTMAYKVKGQTNARIIYSGAANVDRLIQDIKYQL